MKKSKSALIVISLVVLLSVFFFFVPLKDVIKNIPILKGFYQNTTLEITTPNGKAKVKIGNKEYGETPVTIKNLVAGEYKVELTRTGGDTGFYKTHIFNIELTKNSTSRINIEIGPDDNLHGAILYYTDDNTIERGKGNMTITSNNEGTKVYMNKELLYSTPITNISVNKGEYTIKLVSANYEDLEFPIVIREGSVLNIKGYRFPVPVSFEEEGNE